MDEGQYLQNAYPARGVYGGVGRFGFARAARLTEASPLLTPANVSRLRQSWEPYWDANKAIRIEKTPKNLLMTRFLQAAFANACFVVVKRHPVAVSLATQKWSGTSLHSLFEHWLRCHSIFEEDKKHLQHWYEVRYEDYVASPAKHISEIAAFIGTDSAGSRGDEAVDAYNNAYFAQWQEMLDRSWYYRRLAGAYEERFAAHGYCLSEPFCRTPLATKRDGSAARPVDIPSSVGAEIRAFGWHKWTGLEPTASRFWTQLRTTLARRRALCAVRYALALRRRSAKNGTQSI
jgi:hypothetical protein